MKPGLGSVHRNITTWQKRSFQKVSQLSRHRTTAAAVTRHLLPHPTAAGKRSPATLEVASTARPARHRATARIANPLLDSAVPLSPRESFRSSSCRENTRRSVVAAGRSRSSSSITYTSAVMGTRLEMCDSRWCPLPAPLPHSKVDENTSPYMRQGMVVPVSSSSSYSSPAVSEVPSRGGGSAKAVSKSCSSSGPGESKIEPLIVFDWDDTMLTSSWIQVNELLQAGSYDDLPVEAKRDLAHLERR